MPLGDAGSGQTAEVKNCRESTGYLELVTTQGNLVL